MVSSEPLERELPRLRALARRLGHDDEDADDLVHDVWLDASSAPTLPPPGADRQRWLSRVLRNRARMRWRANARRERREHRSALAPSAVASPEDSSHLREVLRSLQLELGKLDPDDRVLVELRLEGLSAAAIAEQRAMVPATVRTRIHRALGRLREGLDRRFGDRRSWLPAVVALRGGWGETTKVAPWTWVVPLVIALIGGVGGWTWLSRQSSTRSTRLTGSAVGGSTEEIGVAKKGGATTAVGARPESQQGATLRPATAREPPETQTTSRRKVRVPDTLYTMNEQAAGCLETVAADASGALRLYARVLDDTDVAGTVESIGVVQDAVGSSTLTECLEQSIYNVDFPPPATSADHGRATLWIIDADVTNRFVAVREWGSADIADPDPPRQLSDLATIDLQGAGMHTTRTREDILDRIEAAGWSRGDRGQWVDPDHGRVFIGCTIVSQTVACATRPL